MRTIEKAYKYRIYPNKQQEELIQKKIELIRQEQQELHKLANSYRDQARTYGEYLSGFGFKFDSSGMITNLENIKNLTNDARYEVIKEALEEYINLTQSKIPNLSEEWWDLQDSIESSKDKIEEARKELERLEKLGFSHMPICMAKTQYSLTDDETKLGRPTGFRITVRQLTVSAGAGFIVALTGAIMKMPGLPKVPAAERIDVDENGIISGLF